MSTLEDLDDLEREDRNKKKDEDGDSDMKDVDAGKKKDEGDALLDDEILRSSTRDIIKRRRMLENELRIMKSEFQRLTHEQTTMKEKVKDNLEKIENNRYPKSTPGAILHTKIRGFEYICKALDLLPASLS
jgi:26S proteasome regulatory subunit T5